MCASRGDPYEAAARIGRRVTGTSDSRSVASVRSTSTGRQHFCARPTRSASPCPDDAANNLPTIRSPTGCGVRPWRGSADRQSRSTALEPTGTAAASPRRPWSVHAQRRAVSTSFASRIGRWRRVATAWSPDQTAAAPNASTRSWAPLPTGAKNLAALRRRHSTVQQATTSVERGGLDTAASHSPMWPTLKMLSEAPSRLRRMADHEPG